MGSTINVARYEQILSRLLDIAFAYYQQHNVNAYLLDLANRFLARGQYEYVIDCLHMFQNLNSPLQGLDLEITSHLLTLAYDIADAPAMQELDEQECAGEEHYQCAE